MADDRIELMAHLMRRVGVGASRDQLEALAERPYEDVVEELLHPENVSDIDRDALDRYFPTSFSPDTPMMWASRWIYDLANSPRPLREKMALFWHHVFATGWFKSEHGPSLVAQIDLFRENGLGNMRQILLDLSRDPAMIHWLDNSENHADAVNENFGRELLELFSMGGDPPAFERVIVPEPRELAEEVHGRSGARGSRAYSRVHARLEGQRLDDTRLELAQDPGALFELALRKQLLREVPEQRRVPGLRRQQLGVQLL